MKQLLILLCCVFISVNAYSQSRVILDTDIDSDVDDVEALAMLHQLANQKQIKFIGIIVTSDDPYAPICVNAINKYYGRPGMPIGFLKNQDILKNHSKYTRAIAEEFPHVLKSHEEVEDAVAVYRKLLVKSPDSSIIIVTIGGLTNLQDLLKSTGDKYSPFSGEELVNRKVKKWLCMGGLFPEGKEANFYRPDPASTIYTLSKWNKPVIFAGWEAGNKVHTGGTYLKNRLSHKSPVYRAYQLYNNFSGRPSWDQLAVLLLTSKANKYFDFVNNGHCYVAEDGSNKWIEGSVGNQKYIKFKPDVNYEEIGKVIDDMIIY